MKKLKRKYLKNLSRLFHMVSVNLIIFSYIVLELPDLSHNLVELSQVENHKKVVSDTVIHHTINNLFRTLELNKVSEQASLNEYNTLHQYFTTLTLQNYENLNEIIKLTRVSNKSDEDRLIAIINNVLEEDNSKILQNEIDISKDADVASFIELFLNNLQHLKKEFNVDKEYVKINADVLELLKNPKVKLGNVSNIDSRLHNFKENDNISSDNEFWEPSGRRIFKGERTKIKYFPFMATIQIFNNFQCAGSIIKSDLIITAASCLQLAWNNRFFRENPAFLSVRVGSSFYNGGGEVIPILEIYFYPGYNPKTLKDNLCLLRLTRQLKFRRRQKNIKKINFDRNEFNLPLNTPGITVVGWGAREHSSIIGNPWKNKLSEAVLDFYPLRECQEVYSRQYVTKNNFCAGFFSRGGGACNRDVGGPGIIYGKLLGVISFGSPVCGMPDAPTVFTKLGFYSDWIEEIMEQYVPVSKKRTTLKPTYDPNMGYIRHVPPKPTTFKIPPITGKIMTPIPISQIDSQLRIIDENVFKDFLATMFNSKEINEYKDILKDDEIVSKDYVAYDKDMVETVADTIYPVTESQNLVEPYTSVLEESVDNENGKNYIDTAYTVMDPEKNPFKYDFSEEVLKIIDNVDLKKIVKEEVMVPSKNEKRHKSKSDHKIKVVKENVMSDDDTNINVKIFSDDKPKNKKDEGMSIPENIFEDLTRAQEDVHDVLPESVLYELLSEVIRDEVSNITVNSCICFIYNFI
ncbi:uncharacterized protein LOC124540217 [Vanessa cardui]|uniref:uncharacterized protein LOC124540217 n=1 Tax=Vanessa cardui TaxID=171605 RepID=UPI001F148CD1|nr:uncharacterized protein LOC124540217 [Vanessa cardui]